MTCYCISSPNTRCILNPYIVLIRLVTISQVLTLGVSEIHILSWYDLLPYFKSYHQVYPKSIYCLDTTYYHTSSPNTRCILNPYTVLIRPVIMFLVQTPVVIDCQDTVLIRPVTISSANTIYLGFIWLDIASPTNYFSHVIFQYTISGWFTIPGHSSVSNSNLSSPSTIYTKYLVKNDYRITWKYFTIKQTFICSKSA